MRRFSLPLRGFQIQVPVSTLASAIEPLRRTLDEHVGLLRSAEAEHPNLPLMEVLEGHLAEFEQNVGTIQTTAQVFEEELSRFESPEVLPRMTLQLIFASIVAQALGLTFEVIDYALEAADNGMSYWWVTGKVTDPHGTVSERPGTSFVFSRERERESEGALLSAWADAFIYCAFASAPYFPWDRWNVISPGYNSPNSGPIERTAATTRVDPVVLPSV